MIALCIKTTVLAIAVLAATTEAHNKMTLPLPTWPDGFYAQNSPSGTIDAAAVLPVPSGMSYTTDSTSNTKAYWTAFNSSKYKSLKELAWDTQTLADGASNECGFSLVDGTPRELPDMVQWDFFTASHQGPCEVWCDDTLTFEDENCALNYPDTPANLPYDKAKCAGSAVLTSYWIALHTTPWQIYTNCAPLSGGSSSNSSTSTTTSSSSGTTQTTPTAPATATKTPSTTTKTPTTAPTTTTATATTAPETTTSTEASADSGSSADAEVDVTEAPAAPTTEAPAAPTTEAPTTDKCSWRLFSIAS
ncbi:hypothetical protein BBJ29_007167 [Phytophthora kernoviae]|uniref:Uncharacterized protein n=1 Tax=Phytophthora kernoviae TaxID=325452 RepID=A0A3F2RS00_9STRA|nr:hypothetical protein BBJ29_007167 [Phytophthora kernoviae]RLN63085.1 hypothetical protein BBP00_00004334 [Phytophthora kernoviae]